MFRPITSTTHFSWSSFRSRLVRHLARIGERIDGDVVFVDGTGATSSGRGGTAITGTGVHRRQVSHADALHGVRVENKFAAMHNSRDRARCTITGITADLEAMRQFHNGGEDGHHCSDGENWTNVRN